MKQTITLLLLVIVGMSSCQKDLYDPSQNQKDTKIEDLIISSDLDWKMAKDAKCKITTDRPVLLSIYEDEAYSKMLAKVPVTPGSDINLPLSILKSAQNVYIQYEVTEGKIVKTSAPIVDGQINFSISPQVTTKANGSTRAASDFSNMGTTIMFPNSTGGTIMFEDNHPELGDYDFNDFVASYKIEVTTYPDINSVKSIKLYMDVRAIGASKVYIPHLRIRSYQLSSVSGLPEVNNEGSGKLDVTLLSDGKAGDNSSGKIVLAFNGAENKGSEKFLNTIEGNQPAPTNKFDVTLHFEKGKCNIDYLYVDGFDLFLATATHKEEIHILGNGPAFTDSGTDYANDNYYKMQENNLVWGISIPSIIDHAYEKANFLDAYPDFEAWVTGSSNEVNKWYEKGNAKYLFKMPK